MGDLWLKGDLEGECVGTPTQGRGSSASARWYKLELKSAVVRNWVEVAGPPSDKRAGKKPFKQDTLVDVTMAAVAPGAADEVHTLNNLEVWDWDLRQHTEGAGETRGTLVGTVYARVSDGNDAPKRAATAAGKATPLMQDTVDRWGCLGVLLALLVVAWLWWNCGPFTALLWSVVVGGSYVMWRLRQRGVVDRRWFLVGLHGVLGLALLALAFGVTLELVDPVLMTTCGSGDGLRVLLVALGVVASSLLMLAWPLRWMWLVWTLLMVMWCGRSRTDCTAQWGGQVIQAIKGVTPELSEVERRLGVTRKPAGAVADGGVEDGGPGVKGQGAGGANDTPTSGTIGNATGGGGGGGTEPGDVDRAGKGTGGGDTMKPTTPPESVGGGGEGTPDEDQQAVERAASEPRMTVEEALQDPEKFFGNNNQRVTLSGDVLFEFDEDKLRPTAQPKLRQVARLLRMNARKKVVLEGHADTIGGNRYNQDLSERRAQAVRTWLVQEAHINPAQVETVGYGANRPLVPRSKSPAAQQPNRRVEIRVLDQGDTPKAR